MPLYAFNIQKRSVPLLSAKNEPRLCRRPPAEGILSKQSRISAKNGLVFNSVDTVLTGDYAGLIPVVAAFVVAYDATTRHSPQAFARPSSLPRCSESHLETGAHTAFVRLLVRPFIDTAGAHEGGLCPVRRYRLNPTRLTTLRPPRLFRCRWPRWYGRSAARRRPAQMFSTT